MSVGSLLGFLFGMPRSAVAASTNEENDSNSALPYRPSTNLEQVSDWLTKILIGVGLVELSQIGPTLASMGHIVAGSLQNPPPRNGGCHASGRNSFFGIRFYRQLSLDPDLLRTSPNDD